MEPFAFVHQIVNFPATPAVFLKETEPVIGREFEGSILHDPRHATMPVFSSPRRNVLDDPITGVIERLEIVGQRCTLLKTQIGNDPFR